MLLFELSNQTSNKHNIACRWLYVSVLIDVTDGSASSRGSGCFAILNDSTCKFYYKVTPYVKPYKKSNRVVTLIPRPDKIQNRYQLLRPFQGSQSLYAGFLLAKGETLVRDQVDPPIIQTLP